MAIWQRVQSLSPARHASRAALYSCLLFTGLTLGFALVIVRQDTAEASYAHLVRSNAAPSTLTEHYVDAARQFANGTGLRFAEMEYQLPQRWEAMLLWVALWTAAGCVVLSRMPLAWIRPGTSLLQGEQRSQLRALTSQTLAHLPLCSWRAGATAVLLGLALGIMSEIISVVQFGIAWHAFESSGGRGPMPPYPSNWIGLLTPIDTVLIALVAFTLPLAATSLPLRARVREAAQETGSWCQRCGYPSAQPAAKCSECGFIAATPNKPPRQLTLSSRTLIACACVLAIIFVFAPIVLQHI